MQKGSTAGKLNGKYVMLKKKKDWLLHLPDSPHFQLLSVKQFPESVFFLRETREQHLKCLVMPLMRLLLGRVHQMEETECDISQYGKGEAPH